MTFLKLNVAGRSGINLVPQDAVYCMDIHEHLSIGEFQRGIVNIHAVLKESDCQDMCALARDFVIEKYSDTQLLTNIERLYDELVGKEI